MTYVQVANAMRLDMTHYVKIIKEHEARRASFNERQEYWRAYFDGLDKSSTDEGMVKDTTTVAR